MKMGKKALSAVVAAAMLAGTTAVGPLSTVWAAEQAQGMPPMGEPPAGAPPGGGPGGGAAPGASQSAVSKISATEGDWSFDLITTTTGSQKTITSTITYYAGKTADVVVVPSVLGGAPVTAIAAQAFGHHGEIAAVYVPDSVVQVEDWAFYDLNRASLISFANPDVTIQEGAFQSSGNAVLYLPAGTSQTSAGGKAVSSAGTEMLTLELENEASAAIAGGRYLNVTGSGSTGLTLNLIASIATSASGLAEDVSRSGSVISFSGKAFEAVEQKVEIYQGFADEVSASELNQTFRSLTDTEADALNAAIAADSSYSQVKTLLQFEEGYYVNGNKVMLDQQYKAYDVKTGEVIAADGTTGMLPSTGSGYYKYVAYRDTDNDGDVDTLFYSSYSVSYTYNTVSIASNNANLNGLSARDTLNPIYLSFANSVVKSEGADDPVVMGRLSADTKENGSKSEAASNEERSVLWADNYGVITVNELHAASSSVGNWAKMSYEAGLSAYNVEIMMEWGMNALLYATNGGTIRVGNPDGPVSTFTASGDGANGIIAGGTGTKAGQEDRPADTASAYVTNAAFHLTGWNNHTADVVYGGYASLKQVLATTGISGSYAVGQSSSLANDFGNGVIDAEDFHTTVYGNRSAGAYVIGGGVITAKNSSFVSKMDAGLVSASGGTFQLENTMATGQIAFRNRGGINASSVSELNYAILIADKDSSGYTVGAKAAQAAAAWKEASGGTELIHYMMSQNGMTIGQLSTNYGIPEETREKLLAALSEIAGEAYTAETLVRGSVLDNTYYNYSAGAYTGETDYSDIPYLTIGSAYGGLVSSVMGFESAGIQLKLSNSSFRNTNGADYQYLLASEAGSEPVVEFNHSDAQGIIWNEGDVNRSVEGRSGSRSSKTTVSFLNSDFTGSFADGSNGLWEAEGLAYLDGSGAATGRNGNYYGAAANWGIHATFGAGSTWTVTHDSYLGSLTLEEGASVAPPAGYQVKMTVNGEETALAAGTYSGEIVVSLVSL